MCNVHILSVYAAEKKKTGRKWELSEKVHRKDVSKTSPRTKIPKQIFELQVFQGNEPHHALSVLNLDAPGTVTVIKS